MLGRLAALSSTVLTVWLGALPDILSPLPYCRVSPPEQVRHPSKLFSHAIVCDLCTVQWESCLPARCRAQIIHCFSFACAFTQVPCTVTAACRRRRAFYLHVSLFLSFFKIKLRLSSLQCIPQTSEISRSFAHSTRLQRTVKKNKKDFFLPALWRKVTISARTSLFSRCTRGVFLMCVEFAGKGRSDVRLFLSFHIPSLFRWSGWIARDTCRDQMLLRGISQSDFSGIIRVLLREVQWNILIRNNDFPCIILISSH